MITLPLVTLADVTAHLPVRSGDASFDERIGLLIDTATAQIETATRRRFTQQVFTQYFRTVRTAEQRYDFSSPGNEDGVYTHARELRYVLQGIPVDPGEAFSVYYDPSRTFAADTALDPSTYSVRHESGLLFVRTPMLDGVNYLKVVYTAGYPPDSPTTPTVLTGVPADLRMACITQVVHLFTRLTTDNIGVDLADRSSRSTVEARFLTKGGLTPEAAALVSPYRQPLIGLG